MKRGKLFISLKMTLIIFFFIGLLSAIAIPKYLNLNKESEANQCRANQIIVETALSLAYAENLSMGINQYPEKLTEAMFEDDTIPTCPHDGKPIEFDLATGTAYCPNHINSHSRSF